MATSVTLTSVQKDAQTGKVYINFAGGFQIEFNSITDVAAWAQGIDKDVDVTRQMCVAYALARSSDLSNINSVANKVFSFDLSAPQPIKVQ